MKEKGKYVIAVIAVVCIIAIVVIYNMSYDKSQMTNLLSKNEVENTVFEDIYSNEIENIVVEETNTVNEFNVSNEPKSNEIKESTMSTIYEQNNDVGSTDKKQEAINLVKQKWGEDITVTFRCDSITSSGEYIIAVTSKSSAMVLNYFKVNLETKTVVVDY